MAVELQKNQPVNAICDQIQNTFNSTPGIIILNAKKTPLFDEFLPMWNVHLFVVMDYL